MQWDRDLNSWSLPEISRRVTVPPFRWHVQETGVGPTVLLVHGAGASVHTWRTLFPELSREFHVIAVDLPGQGFSQAPRGQRLGLDEMSDGLSDLLDDLAVQPHAVIAHSAGAAVALRLATGRDVGRIVGINPALAEFEGIAGWLFPLLARMLTLNPLTAPLFSMGATEERARRLIGGTGSHIDDAGIAYYKRLIGDRAHVDGTLRMMADWRLDRLIDALPDIDTQTLFLTGGNDRAVPPATAIQAADRMPNARVVTFDDLGHLAHEEAPEKILNVALPYLRDG